MKRARIAAVLVLAAVVAGIWLALRPADAEPGALSASGTVEATEADLGFPAGGQIAEIAVREGDVVGAGQVLARLDAAELEARKAASEAQVAAARAVLLEMERGARPEELRQARAAADAARQQLEEARRTRDRARTLLQAGGVSRQEAERAETGYEVARAASEQAAEQLEVVVQGPRTERLAAQQAMVRQAEAQVAQVEAALANSWIRAPFAGVVTVRHREPGETVSPGLPVLTVMNQADRWVRIYFREDEIGRVGIGQAARIYTDSYPDSAFSGRVTFIASEAEFTPRNVQTAEERVKLVYAVKVAVLDDADGALKAGVPADILLTPGR